jgi:hypothetical protein
MASLRVREAGAAPEKLTPMVKAAAALFCDDKTKSSEQAA